MIEHTSYLLFTVTSSMKQKRRTKYSVANNSAVRDVAHMYIDHTASASDGGYAVVTEENAILKTTGFTRFEYKLKPKEELEFQVIEEAQTTRPKMKYLSKSNQTFYSSTRDEHLQFLIDCRHFVDKGLLKEEQLDQLRVSVSLRDHDNKVVYFEYE